MRRSESTVDGDRSAAEFERIVGVCDRFEAGWRRGERPRIEEWLARSPSLSRSALLHELLALELELTRAAGMAPTAGEYRARFPDDTDVVDAVFAEAGPSTAGPKIDRPSATDPAPRASARPASAPLPARIGRYPVLSLLDAGGQGRVFRVVHPALGRDLVLKLAAKRVVEDTPGRELLMAEGQLLAELNHPNLVRVLDLDVDEEGRPFLVMEHVAGCTLDRHAEQGRPAPRRAAAVVAEIARAVAYVHRRGVVHQDIKPRNVLIDEAGRPRLIDFGLARLRHAWTDEPSGPSGGTLMFMAPEQARGEVGRIGPAADIFALGGLLYFLLTGRPPIRGGSRAEALDRARRGDVDIAALRSSGSPRRLQRICLKALAPDPAARFSTADEMAGRLEGFSRSPRRALAVAAGLLSIGILIGAAALRHRTGPMPTPPPPVIASDQALVHVLGRDHPYDLKEALPLRNGDQLWISCQVPRGAHPSVFWLDTEGGLTELAPEVMAGETTDTLRYPPPGPRDVVHLQGPPGTEFVLVCAGRDRPVTRGEVAALLGPGQPLPPLPDRVSLRLGPDGVEPSGPAGLRSISGPAESHLSAAMGPLRTLQRGLRAEASFLAGVAFPHVAN
jgi:hypothetical protein